MVSKEGIAGDEARGGYDGGYGDALSHPQGDAYQFLYFFYQNKIKRKKKREEEEEDMVVMEDMKQMDRI